VIAPCVVHIPIKKIPAHVIVVRAGKHLHNPPKPTKTPPARGTTPTPTVTSPSGSGPPPWSTPQSLYLQVGDRIFVRRPAVFTFSYGSTRYRIPHATITLKCRSLRIGNTAASPATRVLAADLESGEVRVRAGSHARKAMIVSREMLAFATVKDTNFVVERNPRTSLTSAYTLNRAIITADARIPKLRINTRASYTSLANPQGIRLNVWQFDLSPLQRPTTPADALPPYWADGSPCAVGCAPPGLVTGWPLKPFHEQHVVRAGINEVRPANLHVALDIQANDFQATYPIYSGRAYPAATGSYGDYNIRVGPYIYWHVVPRVHAGQWVTAYKTVLGQVENGFGHIAFSQGRTARTLNPLRPGGGLVPYTDTEPPVIGAPQLFADGRVIVRAFDPQSFIHKLSYLTPVLAPSSLAWRLYNSKGHAITGLEWAMRGSQNYPPGDAPIIYAPGASNPGFDCFFRKLICIPNWVYNLAGGLTSPLPFGRMSRDRYTLTVYAWDWKGNTSALDYRFNFPLGSAASALLKEFGPLNPHYDP
jgi:hypothetical protein